MAKRKKKKSKLASGLDKNSKQQLSPIPATIPPPPNMSKQEALKKVMALNEAGQYSESAIICGKVLESHADDIQFLFLLGTIMSELKDYTRASALLSRAIDLRPNFPEAYNNLGNVFVACQKYQEACLSYQKATDINPEYLDAWYNLSYTLKKTQHASAAIETYRKVLDLNPNHLPSLYELPSLLVGYGYMEEAKDLFRRAYKISGDAGPLISSETVMPVIVPPREEVIKVRKRFADAMDKYAKSDLRIEEPQSYIYHSSFRLAYHATNNKELMQKQANMYANASPHLLYTAPHCIEKNYYPKKDGRLRIGFVSRFFYTHSVSRCYNRMIEDLASHEKFDVYLISTERAGIRDAEVNKLVSSVSGEVRTPYKIRDAQKVVGDLKLDVLLYTEIGMDQMTYSLAFSRFAPVQAVLAGHPDTTGIKNIDYFFSCTHAEAAENAQDNYTEELILFSDIPQYLERPTPPTKTFTKKDLKIPEGKNIYSCPMKMQKLHPDFDVTMKDILEKDKNGVILLFEDYGELPGQLKERMRATIPDSIMERIIMVPWAQKDEFSSYLTHSDVIIDPYHFGGGTTNYMIFSLGIPMVTWPSNTLAGMCAKSCYHRMNMDELIAKDFDEYVNIAVKVATDKNYRQQLQEKILSRCDVLYGNETIVSEVSEKLNQLCEEKGII